MNSADYAIPADHVATLVDPSAYADGRIFETYAWLRANRPIGLASPEGFDPFWVVSRFEDVRAISMDNKRFPYGDRNSMLTDKASDTMIRSLTGGKPNFGRSLVNMDPPDHMKYRLLTQKYFMPKHIKTLDAQIAEIADRSAAKLLGRGSVDFVDDIALYYPLEVVMSILGVPQKDLPFMLRLTQEIFAPLDPDSMPEGVDPNDPAAFGKAMQSTIANLDAYFSGLTADRRTNPQNDIATILATAEINGAPMPDFDLLGYYVIIATAGHDTTSSTSSAAMYALATQPETFARVKADLSLIPRLVEEAIRWSTPVKTFMRSPVEDVEYKDMQFRKNDWLMLCYASANRDEDYFPDAELFDMDRTIKEHMAFGFGPHICLGQHLARREIIALFERLVPMLKSVSIDGDIEMTQSFFVNGLKHLPIRYELESEPAAVAA
ncbi:MAG: cytochrome P450 [Sphingobium sp.]